MRNSTESGDFATYVENELLDNPEPEQVAAASLPSSQSAMERLVVALLCFLAAATFAGVGVVALVDGVATGRTRLTGKEVVLTGMNATLAGLTGIAGAIFFIVIYFRQLPARMRGWTALALVVVTSTVLVVIFSK